MKKLLPVAVALLLLVGASVKGDVIPIVATLTNGNEPGGIMPVNSETGLPRISSGEATFTLNTDNPAAPFMTMTVNVVGLDLTGTQSTDANDNLVAAHIHASSTVDPNTVPPTNVGVVWGFFGLPDSDINPDDLVVTPLPAPGIGGTITSKWDLNEGNGGTTLSAQLPNIFAGRSYINFHTAQFGGGEARGPLVVIPEPSSLALVGVSLAAAAGCIWRRRQKRAAV